MNEWLELHEYGGGFSENIRVIGVIRRYS